MKKLGELTDVISGIPLSPEDISENESGIPILRGINITEGFIRHNREIDRYYPKAITDKVHKYILKEKDLVVGMDGSKVGKNVALISKQEEGSILIQRVARIKSLENSDINFIFQIVFSKKFQRYVDIVNTSSGIPHISLNQIKDFQCGFPSLIEQRKIANFLTLIDDRISTQNKIIEECKSLIKGITHHILKDKKANVRLKDCVICNSSSLTENEFEESNGSYPVFGATGVIASTSQYNIDEDSILVIKDGAGVGRVQYVTGKYSTIGTLNYLTTRKNISLKYIYYLLRCFNFDKYKVGSGIPHIYFKDYGNELIYCPSLKEQNKIARALFLVEEKLNTELVILDHYIVMNNYLLQNLFI